MAKVTRVTTVCDSCGQEVETSMFRVGKATGNVHNADLCETCQGKPFGEVMAKVGITGTRARVRGSGSGRRPAAITADALEKLKAERAAEEAAAKPAPRTRKARVAK